MEKIVKKKGNYILLNHDRKIIISVFTEDMITDKLTIYPQPGDELIDGTLKEVQEKYPDYELLSNLKREEQQRIL